MYKAILNETDFLKLMVIQWERSVKCLVKGGGGGGKE